MKNYLLPVFIGAMMMASAVHAQEQTPVSANEAEDSFPQREWQVAIDAARADTRGILEENEKLNEEFDFLQKRLSELTESLDSTKKEIASQESANQDLQKKDELSQAGTKNLDDQLTDLQKQSAAVEAENQNLTRRISEIEEKNRLWQAQLDQLQAQKRGLLLDLKMQQLAREENVQQGESQLSGVRKDLESYQAQEKELNASVQSLEEQKKKMRGEIDAANADNRVLEQKISELKRRQDDQSRRNQALERQSKAAARSGDLPPQMVKEKQTLTVEIEELEKKLEQVRQSVADSKGRIEQKRALMNEIMKLDAENQKLRSDIADALKTDASVGEHLEVYGGESEEPSESGQP